MNLMVVLFDVNSVGNMLATVHSSKVSLKSKKINWVNWRPLFAKITCPARRIGRDRLAVERSKKVIKSNDSLPGALYVKIHSTTTERSGGILVESQLKVQATLQCCVMYGNAAAALFIRR